MTDTGSSLNWSNQLKLQPKYSSEGVEKKYMVFRAYFCCLLKINFCLNRHGYKEGMFYLNKEG